MRSAHLEPPLKLAEQTPALCSNGPLPEVQEVHLRLLKPQALLGPLSPMLFPEKSTMLAARRVSS